MTGATLLFLIVGILAALIGGATLASAIRGRHGDLRKHTAKLIAGMMILAFGLVLAGFAIAWVTTEPYDFTTSNAGAN